MNQPDRAILFEKAMYRLGRLPLERRALEAAAAAVDKGLDLQAFVEAFNSHNEDRLNLARSVERNFEIIHNALVEIIRFGLILKGEMDSNYPANAPRDIRSMQRLHVFDRRRANTLIYLHEIRSGLHHWYPEMFGPEIHQAVTDILANLSYYERFL